MRLRAASHVQTSADRTNMHGCGNSRFDCWTCTVVERDKTSEALLASGDEPMEKLIEFHETLVSQQIVHNSAFSC